jgi:hypothetical protein
VEEIDRSNPRAGPRTVKPLEDHPSGDGGNLDNLSRTPRGGSAPGGRARIFRNVSLREWFIILGVIQESAMSEPIDLSAVPSRFLNPKEWAKLRAFAPNDLLALTYINAPYPDEENPGDFFWDVMVPFKTRFVATTLAGHYSNTAARF